MKKQIDFNRISKLRESKLFCPDYEDEYTLFHKEAHAKILFDHIIRRSGKDGCFESQGNMARFLEWSRDKVIKNLKILLKNNLIVKLSDRGSTNTYFPLTPEYWNPKYWRLTEPMMEDAANLQQEDVVGLQLGTNTGCSKSATGGVVNLQGGCSKSATGGVVNLLHRSMSLEVNPPQERPNNLSPLHIPAREEKENERERERTLCEEQVKSDRPKETSLVVSESSQAQTSESDSRQFPKTVDKQEQPTENKESEIQGKTEKSMLVAEALNEQAESIKSTSLVEKPVLKGTDQKIATGSEDKLLRGGGENFTQNEWEIYATHALQEVGLNYEGFIQYQRNVNLLNFKAFTVDDFSTGKNAFFTAFCAGKGKIYPKNFLASYIGKKTANQKTFSSSDQTTKKKMTAAEVKKIKSEYTERIKAIAE